MDVEGEEQQQDLTSDKEAVIGDEYCLLRDLGEGTFGSVKLGKHL